MSIIIAMIIGEQNNLFLGSSPHGKIGIFSRFIRKFKQSEPNLNKKIDNYLKKAHVLKKKIIF